VLYALLKLEENGYVTEAAPGPSSEAAAFWGASGVDAARAASLLAATPVAVLASGGEDTGPLAEALAMAGVVVQDGAALRVVVTRDYLDPALEALNRRAFGERSRWMPVKPTGSTPWIGPMFRPGAGPCWACLAVRLRANRPVETYLADRSEGAAPIVPPRALLPASARAALDLAALTVARWIVDGGRGSVDDKLLALDLRRPGVEQHTVVRRPQCPACGDPDLMRKRAEAPVVLEPRPKGFTADGGYRIMTP
jgi:ribosomal protein S12 methylthiotransferase accessory factor